MKAFKSPKIILFASNISEMQRSRRSLLGGLKGHHNTANKAIWVKLPKL